MNHQGEGGRGGKGNVLENDIVNVCIHKYIMELTIMYSSNAPVKTMEKKRNDMNYKQWKWSGREA